MPFRDVNDEMIRNDEKVKFSFRTETPVMIANCILHYTIVTIAYYLGR